MGPAAEKSIRLRVAYKSAASLLSEYTRSVGQGLVSLPSQKAVPVGTRFVFELQAQGVDQAVEVLGEVVSVTRLSDGKSLLNIRYDPGPSRDGIDAILGRIFDAHRNEKLRKHPRVPMNVRAQELGKPSPTYTIKDVSLGGMGLELDTPALPRHLTVGTPFLCELSLSVGGLQLYGEIAWAWAPKDGAVAHASFGVSFGKLRADSRERLERIVQLRSLPPPPWKASVSFGMDAVARMPF